MLSKNLSWKMKDGRMKLEVGSWKMEVGRWKNEDGSLKLEDGRWKMEDGSWKLEYGRWKNEVGQFQNLLRKSLVTIFFLFSFLNSLTVKAQCTMCRASLESEGNATKVEAVNDGIVYLMVIPYVLVGIVGYIIFRMYNKKKVEGLE